MTDYDPTPRYRAHVAEVAAATFDWSEAECVGFFGYANGKTLVAGAEYTRAGGDPTMPCSTCPKGQTCWDAHKLKVREIIPGLVGRFEELVAQHPGDVRALMSAWYRESGNRPDPYLGFHLVNMQTAAGGVGIRASIEMPPEKP